MLIPRSPRTICLFSPARSPRTPESVIPLVGHVFRQTGDSRPGAGEPGRTVLLSPCSRRMFALVLRLSFPESYTSAGSFAPQSVGKAHSILFGMSGILGKAGPKHGGICGEVHYCLWPCGHHHRDCTNDEVYPQVHCHLYHLGYHRGPLCWVGLTKGAGNEVRELGVYPEGRASQVVVAIRGEVVDEGPRRYRVGEVRFQDRLSYYLIYSLGPLLGPERRRLLQPASLMVYKFPLMPMAVHWACTTAASLGR